MQASPSPSELAARVETHVGRITGDFATVRDLQALTLGPARRAWRVDLTLGGTGDSRLVLCADGPRPGRLSRRLEYGVTRAAADAGVTLPRPMWLSDELLEGGAWSFFRPWAPGITAGDRVLRARSLARARRDLCERLAGELARIHAITPGTHPDLFDRPPPEDLHPEDEALGALREGIASLREPRPAAAWAWAWLRRHLPPPGIVTLVHGDFRVGRFLLAPAGLTGITGWSRPHWGSPAEDHATLAVRRWRFGHDALAAGGIAHRETFRAACAAASGREVDASRAHWWEVLTNARLAVETVLRAEEDLRQDVADIEVLAQARRAVELEHEALRLASRGPESAWN